MVQHEPTTWCRFGHNVRSATGTLVRHHAGVVTATSTPVRHRGRYSERHDTTPGRRRYRVDRSGAQMSLQLISATLHRGETERRLPLRGALCDNEGDGDSDGERERKRVAGSRSAAPLAFPATVTHSGH